MPKLFGINYTKDELLKKIGDISQLGGVKPVELVSGNEKGTRGVLFRTGTGFNFTVLSDRGMDISQAEYCGKSLCWRSFAGDANPAFFEPQEAGWLRTFFGGLVTTCGLSNVGNSNVDEGEELGVHGRFNSIPAKNVCIDGAWDGDDYIMWTQGSIRESVIFGAKLETTRKISAKLGESRLFIHDIITNIGFETQPLMLLYHINAGFPVVDAGSYFVGPSLEVSPRDERAVKGKEEYYLFHEPVPDYQEGVYFHEMQADSNGQVTVAIINEKINFGIYVKYFKNELPRFNQWKHMGAGDYVVGLEPANCSVGGRSAERAKGTLQFIQPGEVREFHVEIGALTDTDQIKEFKETVKVTGKVKVL